MIILVKSSCHLPWTQLFWKTLDKQVKYFLAFLRAFDLLDADTPRRSWQRRVVLKQVIFLACLYRVTASTSKKSYFLLIFVTSAIHPPTIRHPSAISYEKPITYATMRALQIRIRM